MYKGDVNSVLGAISRLHYSGKSLNGDATLSIEDLFVQYKDDFDLFAMISIAIAEAQDSCSNL
eukprot:4591128-Ditylum_brightwellii.AAC.1